MTSIGRALGSVGAMLAFLLLGPTASAYAGQSLQECIDQAANHDGEPPTCTKVNGSWVASWPDGVTGGGGGGGGGSSALGILLVLGVLVGIGLVVWKVSTARKLATQSGMDPNLATQMTLLTENGLDATYLAASLRKPAVASTEPPPASVSTPAAKRLEELKSLLDSDLINQEEYDERRTAIIEAV